MKNKIKGFFKRTKTVVAAAAIACMTALTSVVACAETGEAAGAGSSMMGTVIADAGEQITNQFSDLVMTIVPVIIGILGVGLVIFGIFALIKLAKKIFGKVAG